MIITQSKILICKNMSLLTSSMKSKTFFSQRDSLREFGKSCIRLLIVQMFCCMFWMVVILMEQELSLLNITWKQSVQTNI
jgi:hypothetical protein